MAAAGGVRVLPASPNWYSSRCSDASSDGRLFGFAARHRVCLLEIGGAAPKFYGTVTAGCRAPSFPVLYERHGAALPPGAAGRTRGGRRDPWRGGDAEDLMGV